MMKADWMESAGMVRVQARRLRRAGFSTDELFTVGLWGLYQAAERFDPSFGDGRVKFENYATPRVRGEILDWMERNQRKAGTADLKSDRAAPDKGMAAVDALDSLARLGIDPGDSPPRKPDDLGASFRGRVFTVGSRSGTLAQWAKWLGMYPSSVKARILRLGPSLALSLPRQKPGRKRQRRLANNRA